LIKSIALTAGKSGITIIFFHHAVVESVARPRSIRIGLQEKLARAGDVKHRSRAESPFSNNCEWRESAVVRKIGASLKQCAN